MFLVLVIVATFVFESEPNQDECNNNIDLTDRKKGKPSQAKWDSLCAFFQPFSLIKNYDFISSTDLGDESIKPLHGIRAIVSIWICAVHIPYFSISAIDNFQFAFSFTDSLVYQIMFSSSFVVDAFFTIRFAIHLNLCDLRFERKHDFDP